MYFLPRRPAPPALLLRLCLFSSLLLESRLAGLEDLVQEVEERQYGWEQCCLDLPGWSEIM